MFSVSVDDGGHKRGQTSRPIVGAEIQTNRIIEPHLYLSSYLLPVLSSGAALCYLLDHRLTIWYAKTTRIFGLIIPIASYTKIFCTLSHHEAQTQDHIQQHPSRANRLNIAQYRKVVHNALWVQLALVCCYVPMSMVEIVTDFSNIYSSHLIVIRGIVVTLAFFNSTLNPFLYCWRISGVRLTVKQSIRRALRCP